MGHPAARRTDADVLAASMDDPELFAVVYDRYAALLLGFFQRRTACPQTAADLTAETFAAAFVSRRRFRDTSDGSALPWLVGIARHELGRVLRRKRVDERARRRIGLERIELDDASYERIEQLGALEPVREELRAALDALPVKLAQAVSLRVALELPYAEVAARLGCSEGAARVRVARGLSRLADRLEPS
jgi:RNA polymerase sigma factor (sigma-70 family)